MSYPKDRLLDERPAQVDVQFEGDADYSRHPDCDVKYIEDASEKDGWRVEIHGPIWVSLIVGEALEKGTAGMVELQLLRDYDDPGNPSIGDKEFAELTWPATPRDQN
jgi:hypothetical protein